MNKSKEKRQPIKVYLRVRPVNSLERSKGSPVIMECINNKEVCVNERPGDKITKTFTFDRVFSPSSNQMEVYRCVASPMIKEVLGGYNCTIFAYGQTGTGKTYTMEGCRGDPSVRWSEDPHSGIIPRALSHLFDELRLLDAEFSVKASYLEIYNEELIDLLSPVDDGNKIRLFEDATKKGGVIVNGLEELTVRNKEEVYLILEKGSRKRQTASTLMNAVSSRSHTVFSITVRIKESRVEDGEEVLRTGKLNLVDLAGSENIGRSGAIDKRAREAGNINQSLLTLGRVITALVERTPHIPYRESKLTRLLQESLGGRTKTCIIATVSPSFCNAEESLSTLDYAHRAKNIQNKPEINQKIGKVALIKEYIEEIDRLKADLIASREKSGVYLAEENYKSMLDQIQIQTREISELLNDKKTLTEVSERREELNRQLSESLQKFEEDLHITRETLKDTKLDRDKQIFLLNHHIETENKLSQQAETLLSVADTATNDVTLLHNTLGRKRNLEESNLTVCRRFAASCKEKLDTMAEHSSNFQKDRLQFHGNMINRLKSSYDSSKEYYKNRHNKLDGLRSMQTNFIMQIRNSNQNLVTKSESLVKDVQDDCTCSINLDAEFLLKCFDKILGKLNEMNAEWAQHQRDHQNLIKDVAAELQEQQLHFDRFMLDTDRNLEALRNGVEVQEAIMTRIGGVSKDIQELKLSIEEEAREAFEAMQKRYRELEIKANSLQNCLSEIDSRSLNLPLENIHVGMKESQNKIAIRKETISNLVSECGEKTSLCISTTNNVVLSVSETIKEQKLLVPEQQRLRIAKMDEGLRNVHHNVVFYNSDIETAAEGLESNVEIFTEEEKSGLKCHLEHETNLVQTCEEDIQKESQCVNNYTIDLNDKVSDCKNLLLKFVEEEIKRDAPSGNTPQRREYRYPQSLVCTSPHERILSRFRPVEEEKEEIETSSETSNSSSEESVVSTDSSLHVRLEKRKSVSESNISNPNCVSFPTTSEPNIPFVMDKENTSPLKNLLAKKTQVLKKQVLREHNE